ncbi:MAG: hypothetical protein B7Y39_16705 [Bdellovibrio sp. 28-41-41]|nr:MAG: hypothetical protein B7Y39_16705 [Bdellovibrio sp. 28-41-41]
MKNWKLSATLGVTMVLVLFGLLTGCSKASEPATADETVEGESDLGAESSFKMDSASDCVTNFSSRPFLSLVASRRGWGTSQITAFCAKLEEVKTAYAKSSTLTVATIAGFGAISGSTANSVGGAMYVGAVGYDLTAIKNWIQAAVGDGNIRRCMRKAAVRRVALGYVPKGFVMSCLEDQSGVAYPGSLFKVRLSTVKLSDLADVAVGGGISVTLLNVPGVGIVVGFLGGAFYAESNPAYGAFIGCGAMAGVVSTGAAAATSICMGAAFADDAEGSVPTTP